MVSRMTNIENGFSEDELLVYISGYHLLLCLETHHAALIPQAHQQKLYSAQSCHFRESSQPRLHNGESTNAAATPSNAVSLKRGTRIFLRRLRLTCNVEKSSGAVPTFGYDKIRCCTKCGHCSSLRLEPMVNLI